MSSPVADVSVRAARAGDSAAVAEVQVEAWRTDYAPQLPEGALDALDDAVVEARWRAAITAPPSPAHRLLVALESGRLVGFVAVGPADDGDATDSDGELYALSVEPGMQRRGHGSRLLAAAAETLIETGFRVARMWTLDADTPLHGFLGGAGWEPDGATRSLDMGEPVGQQRWHAALVD